MADIALLRLSLPLISRQGRATPLELPLFLSERPIRAAKVPPVRLKLYRIVSQKQIGQTSYAPDCLSKLMYPQQAQG